MNTDDNDRNDSPLYDTLLGYLRSGRPAAFRAWVMDYGTAESLDAPATDFYEQRSVGEVALLTKLLPSPRATVGDVAMLFARDGQEQAPIAGARRLTREAIAAGLVEWVIDDLIEFDEDDDDEAGEDAGDLREAPAVVAKAPVPIAVSTLTAVVDRGGSPVPLEREALRAWAKARALTRLLQTPLTEIRLAALDLYSRRTLAGRRPVPTMEDLVVDPGQGRGVVSSLLAEQGWERLRKETLAFLTRLDEQYTVLIAAREARLARRQPPVHPALVPLSTALTGILSSLYAAHGTIPQSSDERAGIEWKPDRGALFVWPSDNGLQRHVVLDLRAFPDGPIGVACACQQPDCSTIREALDATLDWLGASTATGARAALIEHLAQPAWERSLVALGRATVAGAAHAAVESRLIFKLITSRYQTKVSPLLQTRKKNGDWTAGKVFSLRYDRSDEVRDPIVNAAIRICDDYQHGPAEALAVLELLAGKALVYAEEDRSAPLELRRAEPRLTVLSKAEDKLTLALTLDGDPLSAPAVAQSLSLGGVVIFVDPSRRLCLLARLSTAHMALARTLADFPGSYPREAQPSLVRALGALSERVSITWSDELAAEAIDADGRLVVQLAAVDEGLEVRLRVRPIEGGPTFAPGVGPAPVTSLRAADGALVRAQRDLAAEARQADALVSSLPLSAPPPAGTHTFVVPGSIDGEEALDVLAFLESRSDVLTSWADPGQRRFVRREIANSQLRVQVSDRVDWFGLDGSVELDGEIVALGALLAAVRDGRRYVKVGPGQFARIAAELRARLSVVADVVHAGRAGIEVSAAAMPALSDLLDGAREADISRRWLQLRARLRASSVEVIAPPAGLTASLRPYQLEGYQWLSRLSRWGLGACLADDMGLGKTVQALALLVERAPAGPALVVAPTSVCFNWVREAERFAPGLRVRLLREGDRKKTIEELGPGDLLVASYGLLLRHQEELTAQRFCTLVLDEAQAIKNAGTRRARAARDLQADFRVALTGTPVENHVGELWSLLRAVVPGLLGSWDEFRKRFAGPIENGRDKERMGALARLVAPFILRRSKSEVARDLPARTDIRRMVTMPPEQKRAYEEERQAIVARLSAPAEVDKPEQQRFVVLAAITRLRQLACAPQLVDPSSSVPSGKLEALVELVEELRESGHRALIFSQFTTHLALVRAALAAKLPAMQIQYLDGQTPEHERRRRVDAFQRGEGDAFLISLKAGGTGLNLTGADYVVHLDPWWNPAVEDQASDRAHRIGQTRPVTVYRLVSEGTIEEAILAMHGRKRDLVANLLDGTDAAARLSTDELVDLIRGGVREGAEDESEGSDERDVERDRGAPIAGLALAREAAGGVTSAAVEPSTHEAPSAEEEPSTDEEPSAVENVENVEPATASEALDLDALLVDYEASMRRDDVPASTVTLQMAILRRFSKHVRQTGGAATITDANALERIGDAYCSGLGKQRRTGSEVATMFAEAALIRLLAHARRPRP